MTKPVTKINPRAITLANTTEEKNYQFPLQAPQLFPGVVPKGSNAPVLAMDAPATTAAKTFGYQTPSSTPIVDALYPQWLCSVTSFPSGLVTPGCTPSGSSTASGTYSFK